MVKPRLHAGHMEIAVAELIGWRQNIIVPNVYWGLNLHHEADLLVLDKSGRFTEIEIKISKSDLKADLKKEHNHQNKIISRLIFAVPDELVETAKQLLSKNVGIISVEWNPYYLKYEAKWVRISKHQVIEKPDQKTILKFMHLGCMRIWSLKHALINRK